MDPWEDINPYASSSGSKYGNPLSNLETPNRTNANQTSRCIWGQADKSSQPTLNHSLRNVFEEGELNSRSAQRQWGKTNNYVGGISGASIKNGTLYKKSEQPSSYTAQCQWKNEEVPSSDACGEEESSYRSSWKNKYDCISRNNVAAERASGLPTETRLECRRSLFDINYETKTELQTRDYHSGRDHNNVAEYKLKRGSNSDGLDYVGEIKSDYDNLPEIRLQERDRQDLREYYYSDKSDDDSSFEENYLVDIELAKRNMQLKKQYNCGLETQLRRKDDHPYKTHDVVVKTELDESHDLVVVKTEVEEGPDFEETFDYTAETRLRKRNLSADWEYVGEPQPKKQNVESDKTHKHPNQADYHSAWSRLFSKRDDYSDAYLRNRDRHLEETDCSSHGYPNAGLEMNDNSDNKKQPKKREESVGVRKGLMSSVSGGTARLISQAPKIQQPPGQLPQMGKKKRTRVRPFRMLLPSGERLKLKRSDAIALGLLKQESKDVTPATDDHVTEARWDKRSDGNRNDQLQLDKREYIPHTTNDNATKSRWDQKDNQDKNCYDKSDINSWSFGEPLEEIKEVPYTTDDNTTESWDKKYNHQDNSYHDKNNIWSFLGQLDKIKEGSRATDDDTTESRLDKKDSRDKSYHDENNIWSFLGQLGKITEVSHTTDDNATKSRWDQKYNHQDENYHDENNKNKKDELEKRETVSQTADCVTKSDRDKKDNCQDKNYRDKNNRNKKDELDKKEVSHTTDNYVTKSSRDNKDNYRKDDKNNRNQKNELEKRETVSHTADCVTKSHRDKKDCDKNNRNKKDELHKRDKVSHRTGDYVANSRRDKKDKRQDNNYRDKNNRNKKDELDKRKVSHTTKSCRDNKDNHRDKNYDKDNRNKKDQREKREEVSHKSRDKKDNCQDKNYRDKNNRNKKDELDKREEVSQTNDDCGTKSHRDKKYNDRDNSYDKDNRNKKDQREKREEVSQRTDDVTKSSCDNRDNHQDKNCHDKGKDTVQKGLKVDIFAIKRELEEKVRKTRMNCHDKGKDTVEKGLKIDIFAIKRELEEKIRKTRMIKNLSAQLSDYLNVQSNPTAATLLGSTQCDSNGSPYTVTKTVSENQNNFDQQAVSLGQLHLNTTPKEDKASLQNSPLFSNYQNPNFLLPGSEKEHYLQALGDKGNINYPYIWPGPGPAAQRKLEAQKAMERFLERIGMNNVINIIPFKSDCSVTNLRENLRIIDSSDKYWTHLAGLCYHIVQKKERLLKTTNINYQFELVKEVQRHYSVLNAMILGKLDVADGPKHMQILRQWLQQSNANSTMTGTIGFSFNYLFNYDSALEIDYEEVIKRFSNDRKLEISTMLHIGNDVCTGHGWIEHLLHHKSLYEAVILSNYSADSIKQFEKNYLQLKENAAKVAFKHNTTYEISSKEESLKPNPKLQIVNSYAVEQQPPQEHNFPYVGQYNTTLYNSNDLQWQRERNNMHMTEWRKPRVAPMNTQLQHQSPPANLLPFPHAQGVEPSQPPHGVNLASIALPCMSVPPPIIIPVEKNLDSLILVPATAYKLFEAAGYDFIGKLCEQTNLKIDLIKEQGVSNVQYICTLQGPDEEKLKAKAAIIKFCNGGHDVGS